jgi:hypothetical protein
MKKQIHIFGVKIRPIIEYHKQNLSLEIFDHNWDWVEEKSLNWFNLVEIKK